MTFKPYKLNDNCYLSNSWSWTPVSHLLQHQFKQFWTLIAEAERLRFIEVSGPCCANIHPWQGHYKVWHLGAPHPGQVRHSDSQKEQINLPLPSHDGSLVIYRNDRHGGKAGEGIVLFSRHLDMCWRGYWALQPSAKRQLLLLARGYFGTCLYPELL